VLSNIICEGRYLLEQALNVDEQIILEENAYNTAKE
jgi:hypothetical protein